MVRVLVLNGSPNRDKGNTALILTPFLKGMEEMRAEIDIIYPRDLKIRPCTGEMHCWFKHPGECYIKDDMTEFYPKLREADILVLASPLYIHGITGPLKNLLDRTLPYFDAYLELREGHSQHCIREGFKRAKVALVSNCGFWELDNFDPLVTWVQAYCKCADYEFVGALLRPHGPHLNRFINQGLPVNDILEAAEAAGRQLVTKGQISEETLQIISRELEPVENWLTNTNQVIKYTIESFRKE